MHSKRMSIVMPTFNRVDLLQDAIWSALNQVYQNKEIVVIEEGSGASTESVVRTFGSYAKVGDGMKG
jgi:glycosyltransferase involved in cell wall biosynthesis